jgi:hypothetical protein
MAIITALLVLMLASGLMAGMFAALIADQKSHATDRDQSMAYAAAHAGLEKLTSNLGALFDTDFSPSAAQINTIDNFPPTIPNFEYTAPGGTVGSGYQISFTPDPGPGANTGNPLAAVGTITTGNWDGLQGLITPYIITVTAKSSTGNSEVRLRRELQTVAVPVFQFGIFGQNDLGFHAGPNFSFGGRVHTNGSLFLAQGNSNQLTLSDKVTAFTQVVRDKIMNGAAITTTGHSGTVRVRDSGSTYRNLLATETSGTVAAPCVGSATTNSNCWTGWKNLSEVTYATNIRTQATGAKLLNLPLAQQGAAPIDLVRRPVVLSNENTANPVVYAQRYYAQASLRILLSDRAADITGLPAVSAGAPIELTPAALLAAGYVVGAGTPPLGASPRIEPEVLNIFTRVSAIAGTTLTVQTAAAAGGPWTSGVPLWLRWTLITVPVAGTTVLNCTGMTSNQLNGCVAPIPAIANNTVVTIQRPDYPDVTTARVSPAYPGVGGASTNNIIPVTNFTTAQQFVASRVFFVGEDPVTCTGFTATTLTGCTWSGAATLTANDPAYSGATTTLIDTPYLHGFLKIERQNAAGVWSDVTMELLNLGFAARNQEGDLCADPTPNAVIRLQRLRDSGLAVGGCALAANNYSASLDARDFWPNTIFDAREGNTRLLATNAGMNVGGIFTHVALDVDNYRRWLAGTIGATGNQSLSNNGYIVYFSDRRGNHDPLAAIVNAETGEYGFEDSLNPVAAAWAKDFTLNIGEDYNQNATLQSYGETPWPGDAGAPNYLAVGAVAPFDGTTPGSAPWATIPLNRSGRGRLARPVLFRRALKIVNGGMVGAVNNVPAAGFTVASENPVYVQGNFNATTTDPTAEPNVATSIVADAITLLSNVFVDAVTFRRPNDANNRNATETAYRFAMITGKAVPFQHPGWGVTEWGSDGGVHNFMRMLEDWGGQNLRYRGSMVSLWFGRQAIGPYRADANVYSPPTRGYAFDVDFLTPALLPPGTPAFRDINTLKFRQILRPNQ